MLENIYAIFVSISMYSVAAEMTGKYREGAAIQKKKCANGNSRMSKIISLSCITLQTFTLIVGFILGHNNWVPIAMLAPIGFMYIWLLYLCFKYKKTKFNPWRVQ